MKRRLIGWGIIFITWGLVYHATPLWMETRELSFIEQIQSWRDWLAFGLILIAFWLREWRGHYEERNK